MCGNLFEMLLRTIDFSVTIHSYSELQIIENSLFNPTAVHLFRNLSGGTLVRIWQLDFWYRIFRL